MRSALLIVNADDLGTSEDTNHQIYALMATGVVRSATLIGNSPAFESAIARVREFPQCSFGAHLNLTVMRPLAPSPDLEPVLDEHGHLSQRLWSSRLSRPLVQALERELTAQVQRILDSGVRVSHFDSHQHIHVIPGLFLMLKRLQRRFGVRRMRPTVNVLGASGQQAWPRMLKKAVYRTALKHIYATRTPDGLCDFSVLLECLRAGVFPPCERLEVMVHPGASSHRFAIENADLRGAWQAMLPAGTRMGTYYDL